MSRFIVARFGISHHVTIAIKPLLSFPVTMVITRRCICTEKLLYRSQNVNQPPLLMQATAQPYNLKYFLAQILQTEGGSCEGLLMQAQ